MNNLQIFNYEAKQIRTILKDGQPWFVAKDVCDVLDITNPTMATSRLDDDEVTKFNLGGLSGETNIVSESGLYSLVLGSRKPEAKQFKRWITHEVIPTIRKTGGYVNDSETFINSYLPSIDETTKLMLVTALEETKRLHKQLETQRPLVSFAETCLSSKDSILVRELAKVASKQGIEIGEKRLYKKLRDWGYIMKGSTEPYQKGMTAGYFEVIERATSSAYGTMITKTTLVTPKGQVYIIERLKKEAA